MNRIKEALGRFIFLEVVMEYQALKEKYGTPLYIYNVDLMKEIITKFKNNFKSSFFQTEILYASKAFCVKEMLRLIQKENLSLDVVSLGELITAKAIGFDMAKVYFHGNNKSEEELRFALKEQVGYIVVDNLMELKKLEQLCIEMKVCVQVYFRLNVGVEAHTHKFVVTAHIDSKFGILYHSKEYEEMIFIVQSSKYIHLVGFHSHIGSQIFDLNAFGAAIKKLVEICKEFCYPLCLNIGGGFGAKYTNRDHPVAYDIVARYLVETVEKELEKEQVHIAKLCIEPGRSIVAEAGTTLYTIGYIKQTPNKLYYFIDGGMTDNIRPALYQADYTADIVGKENVLKNKVVTVAGKCCESGDIIIDNILLPEAKEGDLLITYSTGAYGYSMSSNYNKAVTPAVIFVENGLDRVAVKRQTYEELLEREI